MLQDDDAQLKGLQRLQTKGWPGINARLQSIPRSAIPFHKKNVQFELRETGQGGQQRKEVVSETQLSFERQSAQIRKSGDDARQQ